MNANLAVIESDSVVISMMRANSALAGAVTVSQTKKIMDVARAAEIYAKRQHLSDEAIGQATSVKVEAMRKLGEILQASPKAKGVAGRFTGGSKKVPPAEDVPTLDELGLTKKESAVAQKLASLPVKAFEQVRDGSMTIAKAIAAVDATKPATTVATPKPAMVVVPATVIKPEDQYTELDAKNDQIADLQSMLAVANLGTVAEGDKDQAKNLIAELRAEIKTLRATLKVVTTSRDGLMNELAQVKRQCIAQQRELKRFKGNKAA